MTEPAEKAGEPRIDPMQDPKRPGYFMNYAEDETPAEMVLRKLACWLGVGGYNAPKVDAEVFHDKIIWGVEHLLSVAGKPAEKAGEQGALTPDDRKELPFTIKNAVEAGPGVVLVAGDYLARICRAALASEAPAEAGSAPLTSEQAKAIGLSCAALANSEFERGRRAGSAPLTLPIEIHGKLYDVPIAVQVHIVSLQAQLAESRAGSAPLAALMAADKILDALHLEIMTEDRMGTAAFHEARKLVKAALATPLSPPT